MNGLETISEPFNLPRAHHEFPSFTPYLFKALLLCFGNWLLILQLQGLLQTAYVLFFAETSLTQQTHYFDINITKSMIKKWIIVMK